MRILGSKFAIVFPNLRFSCDGKENQDEAKREREKTLA